MPDDPTTAEQDEIPSLPPPEHASDAFTDVAPFYDKLMSSVPYDYWADYLEELFDRHGIRPDKLLDIGCGTGAVTIQMAQRGYDCHGVDISDAMLEYARRNARDSGLAIRYTCQDAAELKLTGQRFESAISLFDSLNNITVPERLAAAFAHVFHHLTTPGIFVFDLNAEYAFKTGMFSQKSTPLDGELQYVWKSRNDSETRLCVVDMAFEHTPEGHPPRVFHERHVQRAYGKDEIVRMLREAGFDHVWAYDGYTFKSTRRRTDRIFFVASKGLRIRPAYASAAQPLRRRQI